MITPSPPLRILVFLALLLASAHLRAQSTAAVETPSLAKVKTLTLGLGRSQIIEAPWFVKRISVTNPEVADVQALTPQKILLLGKAIGTTDVFLWSESEEVWQAQVDIIADLEQLKGVVSKAFPGCELSMTQVRDVIVVSGSLARAEQNAQLRALLEAAGFKFVDRTTLAGVQQVQIKVRVAEVSRTAIRALSVNAFQVGEDAFGAQVVGPATGGALTPVNIGVPENALARPDLPFVFNNATGVSPAVTLFGGLPDHNLEVFVQALAEDQYLRILSEPTLVALSGEEASFLAGGEFPIPVVQGASAGGNATITIEYKEFGVRLSFRPVVLGDATIRLKVEPEVSELTDTGAVEIQGFRVPSLLTRRSATTLELKSGQTFAMAGLLSSRKDARKSRIPILGDIPVLGVLFRSTRYERGETELIVLATASLVEPLSLSQAPPVPGSVEMAENDWEFFLEASIKGEMPGTPSRQDPAVLKSLGLSRLKGPGAWANHDKEAVRARPRKSAAEEDAAPGRGGAQPAASQPPAPGEAATQPAKAEVKE